MKRKVKADNIHDQILFSVYNFIVFLSCQTYLVFMLFAYSINILKIMNIKKRSYRKEYSIINIIEACQSEKNLQELCDKIGKNLILIYYKCLKNR